MTKKLIISVFALDAAMTVSADSPYFGARLAMDVTVPSQSKGYYKTGSGFSVGAICNMSVYKQIYDVLL